MAADAVSAVANAIGSGFNMVSSFVNKAAQRYGLTKGMEAGTLAFEQQKTLAAYAGVSAQRQSTTIAVIALIAIIVLFILFNRKK